MQGRGTTPGQHAIKDTPRGSASLAPAVVANPKMAIGTVSRGDEPNSHMNAVNPAQQISPAGGGMEGGATPHLPGNEVTIFELLGQKMLSRTKPGDHLKPPFPHINYNNNE